MNFLDRLLKRATYIFEKPMASNALSERDNNEFFKIVSKNKIKIKSGYCLRLNPAVKELKKIINDNLKNVLKININTNSFLPLWRKKIIQNQFPQKKIMVVVSLMSLVMK